MLQKIKNLQKQVEHILWIFPSTRNSDIELTIQLWRHYYPSVIFDDKNGRQSVNLLHLFDLPREDNVKRCRAKIQNTLGKWLPTDQKVAEQRGINEQAWRKAMGTQTPQMV